MRAVLKEAARACLLLACLCAAARAQAPPAEARRDDWRRLLAFEGRDVWALRGEGLEEVAALVNRLVPDRREPGSFAYNLYRPRLLERVETPGGVRHVLLVSPSMLFLPGQQWHAVHFFDEDGGLRGSSDFSSGWRVLVGEVALHARGGAGAPLLRMGVGGSPLRLTAEYYALLGDRAVLVRLEGEGGRPARNSYGCEYPSVGPPAPRRTAEEWARALASGDAVERSQALMWVGGRHATLEDLKDEQGQERRLEARHPELKGAGGATLDRCPAAADDAVLYAAVRGRGDVTARLRELARSEDVWVRQAAALALSPPKGYE